MRRFRKTVTILGVIAVMATLVAAPATGSITEPGLPVYLSMGDSWTAGQGATDPAIDGFVPQFFGALQAELDCLPAESDNAANGCKHLNMVHVGRTATDELPGVITRAVIDEQLSVVGPMLEARNHDRNPRNNVEVISLQVGGNDVFGPVISACPVGLTDPCVETLRFELGTLAVDLDEAVSMTREAAGDDAIIVLGTYGNSAPYCYLAGFPGSEQLGAILLEGFDPLGINGINDIVRDVASSYDAEVSEVFHLLGEGDFQDDCLHLTDQGYDKVTEAYLAAAGL